VLAKSATLVEQTGNPLPRYKEFPMGEFCPASINSEGLPNAGINYYVSEEVVTGITGLNKPYFVSLSGLSLKDNLEMLDRAMKVEGISSIELNLACPNIPGKPTMAYDFEQMDAVLEAVCAHPLFNNKPLGVKLAPYFDIPHFQRAATILNKHPIKYVVCTNTIGNALVVDGENEQAMIKPKGGFGGLGGGYVKPVALANVRQFSQLLRADIDVVGVGGVTSGMDAFELILCGAKAVQIGTKHWSEGASCFTRVAGELEAIMNRKGYKSIEDFRGKLKEYSIAPKKKEKSVDYRLLFHLLLLLFPIVVAIFLARDQGYLSK
jgi:dihydroorotate dehydrogenase (fumarate)